jgi:hypothetical protein
VPSTCGIAYVSTTCYPPPRRISDVSLVISKSRAAERETGVAVHRHIFASRLRLVPAWCRREVTLCVGFQTAHYSTSNLVPPKVNDSAWVRNRTQVSLPASLRYLHNPIVTSIARQLVACLLDARNEYGVRVDSLRWHPPAPSQAGRKSKEI